MTDERAQKVQRYVWLESAELVLINLAQQFDLFGMLGEDDLLFPESAQLNEELWPEADARPSLCLADARVAADVARALIALATDEARTYLLERAQWFAEHAEQQIRQATEPQPAVA